MTIRTFPDAEVLAAAAADEVASLARPAIAARGRFDVALSGGSTPGRMFGQLARRPDMPWDRIHLWWGDERTVAPDHPDSNYGVAKRLLIDPLGLRHVTRMAGEGDPRTAARDYEAALVAALGTPPVFDLVLLGMGADGHTASLFPGSAGLHETERYVVANQTGATTRLTLTFPAIAAARHTRILVAGADKAEMLARVLEGPAGAVPVQQVTGADVMWLVDAAAASRLARKDGHA